MSVLLIDNYDSFTWNLQHYLVRCGAEVKVLRNDVVDPEEAGQYSHFVFSPGPGLPSDAGLMPELISRYYSSKKILGVCLGMQAIGEFFGAELVNLNKVYHGVSRKCIITDSADPLFYSFEKEFMAGRYHSWVVAPEKLPGEMKVTSVDEEGFMMSFRHTKFSIHGVQFHPESVLTPNGLKIIENWIQRC